MSILENTISMLEVLPETDLIRIQDFVKNIVRQRGMDCPFPLLSKEEILQDLELSERQFASGEYQEAREFLGEFRQEYDL